jgi:hypothetical protein
MEPRKLTKEDIDKVRDIEGFPIGTDEDIIALSNAPYYTACPNPFIEEFIRQNGTPYDEETDDYHREPFAADVSEGKNDPIYMAHSYHTKVPYRAIMKYILHYTKPGDIVFDGFCGTGMTGVAANMCGTANSLIRYEEELVQKDIIWGARKAILIDLSSLASFIAYIYNHEVDYSVLQEEFNKVIKACQEKYSWMYTTNHQHDGQFPLGNKTKGHINYTVWSEVLTCPNCGYESKYYDLVTASGKNSKSKTYTCPHCNGEFSKTEFIRALEAYLDPGNNQVAERIKRVPVKIFYTFGRKKYEKAVEDGDIKLLENINSSKSDWYPTEKIMFSGTEWGDTYRAGYHTGVNAIHHFFTDRNIRALAAIFAESEDCKNKGIIRGTMLSCLARASIRNRYIPEYGNRHVGTLSGTLYIPSLIEENNIFDAFSLRAKKVLKAYQLTKNHDENYCISCSSITETGLSNNCIDYIFIDPPFGDNLIYSELNFISEAWLKVFTNQTNEAIISPAQNKALPEYQTLMREAFSECYRILKPNRWITVAFHNSKNAVWNCIQTTLQAAGFIVADVRVLDKQKGTTKQLSYTSTVKQDLVISAYKPKEIFKQSFIENAGTEESAWTFVRQHLEKLPVVVVKGNTIEIISERQAYLLFDRMVAYHIMNGIPVPLDATDFYRGLDDKFLKRDDMYFLPDQVNEYDTARIKMDIEPVQFSLFVTNEKTAIAWLYQQLDKPQTYADIQPKFMQEVKAVDKFEAIPELAVLLEENFLQDKKGRWYIPDRTKEGDVTKLREKKLWKEFEGYLNSKGKLKLFRSEAIRVGFSRLWQDKNYQAIVELAERLPEQTIQEDPNLLMYYDISLGRM